MNKRLLLVVILFILIVILCSVGVYSYVSYNKQSKNNNKHEENSDLINDYEFEYKTKEEVIDAIISNYSDGDLDVTYLNSENDCWYFIDTKQVKYSYCVNDPVIRILK